MDDGSWALAVSLGHVRNAVVAFVAAEDPSGASLFLAAECLELEGLFADTAMRAWQQAGFAEVRRRMSTVRPAGEAAADIVLAQVAGGRLERASKAGA